MRREKGTINYSVILGAAFLMATSAIGPGFLTQTSLFTAQYMSQLFLGILCVIIMDMVAQANIWLVIGASGLRGSEIADRVANHLGVFLTALVSVGGFAFNIGNVGGTALGLNALTGINPRLAVLLSGGLAICVFLSKSGRNVVDRLAQLCGVLIIVAMFIVTVKSEPPVHETVQTLFMPKDTNLLLPVIVTMLGGSCGGYIPFAGAHRLLDAGYGGERQVSAFRKSVFTGVLVSGIVRILLFFSVLGVCSAGGAMAAEAIADAANPAAEAFKLAAGTLGYRLFGLALFAAGITSVIGAAYCSVSFLRTRSSFVEKKEKWVTIGFIATSTIVMLVLNGAKRMIIFAGGINGLILPISLACVLIGANKKSVIGAYKHPLLLQVLGWIVVFASGYLAVTSFGNITKAFG